MSNTDTYMFGRAKWARPQGVIFSNNVGTFTGSTAYIPNGTEYEDFIILTDHNRGPISLSNNRIESRQRMINGRMRSYHIADKLVLSLSWQRVPSRAFSEDPEFDSFGKLIENGIQTYTADAAAAAMDMVSWYESHPDSFYVYLAYDKYRVNAGGLFDNPVEWGTYYDRFFTYSQVLKMYFTSFDYSVEQRGRDGYDLMNVNMTLEEA